MNSFIWSLTKRLTMAEAEMTGTDDTTLVGISLTGETGCCHDNQSDDTSLGFILMNVGDISINKMRITMQEQLNSMPSSYRFLTRQGWPVTSTQESIIQIKHLINEEGVIRIQPDYAEPRIGVLTETNDALGFVFVSSLTLSISQLREAIVAQLGGSQIILSATDSDWMFLDRNSWPICRQQEEQMTVIDIIVRASVKIHFCHKFRQSIDLPDVGDLKALPDLQYTPGTPPAKRNRVPLSHLPRFDTDDMETLSQMGHSPGPLMSNNTAFHATTGYPSHTMRSLSPVPPTPITPSAVPPKPESAKQILISYVRAEASQYALDLKEELENMHFSVYLDVHEIFCGSDWQDSLNFAVSHCSVFVPLVTPRYGETQWTNREVKLADILSKFIVPVSFLESWPPRCLAIQFATTQFISWKLPAPGMKHNEAFFHPVIEKGSDKSEVTYTYEWDRPDVAMVAKEIGKRSNAELKRRESEDEDKAPQLRSYASILPRGVGDDLAIVQESREGKPLVVISGHPEQRTYATELVELFESQGYEVWCSLDVHDETNHSNSYMEEQDTQIIEDGDNGETCDIDALSPEPVKQFVAKADEAGVVVFVLSKAFAMSVTCKEQVFYCETRKRVVPLVFEDFEMPGWMSMLIGTSTMEHTQISNYKESLLNRVKRSLNANSSDVVSDVAKEAQNSKYVEYVCNRLPEAKCVYISGGTQFFCDKSDAICKAIGYSLARQERNDIAIVTGGFYGVGEVISRSFYDEREKRNLKRNVWHIVPIKDEQDRSKQTRQNPDKTFKEVPFGETIFCGDSVRQRETIVSRVFDIAILVEGGPGAAHEAEEFVWSDHTVIPIRCTGGAAGGKFKVPEKIFEVPPGVSRDDWAILADSNMHASKIGEAVARIIKVIQTGAAAQITRMKSISSKRGSLVSQHSFIES